MSGASEPFHAKRLLGFPPRTHHLLLPERPAVAARAGLGLYDATLTHQRAAAAIGDALFRARLGPLLRARTLPNALALDWWTDWCHAVGRELIGDIHRIAFRMWEDRVAGLLLDRVGRPLAFVKAWPDLPHLGSGHGQSDPPAAALAAMARNPPSAFRTPAIMARGSFGPHQYVVFEPLPFGRHRPMRPDPVRLHRIVDEIQGQLSELPRPETVPGNYVVSHGDLTPRNLRIASDGHAWLFDWEYAGWAPALADELRFWVSEAAHRLRLRPDHNGRRIAAILVQRGSREDIVDALRWEEFIPSREAAVRAVVLRAVMARG